MTNLFNRNDGTFAQVDMASLSPGLTSVTKATTADITLSTTSYIDGPSVTQGSSGTWYVSGSVTLGSTGGGSSRFFVRLWDGTTTIAAGASSFLGASSAAAISVSLSGIMASPAGNLRISVANNSDPVSKILFNNSGFSLDSSVVAVRIA